MTSQAPTAYVAPPLISGNPTFQSVSDDIAGVTERKQPVVWYLGFALFFSILLMFGGITGYLFWEGVGIWGLNVPVAWGWAIVNFVWWVGIGHAGTLISAILFLFRQRWQRAKRSGRGFRRRDHQFFWYTGKGESNIIHA